MPESNDQFELYDLEVEVVAGETPMVCSHTVGDRFRVEGENLKGFPESGFSMYALAALLPLLPAKQRVTDSNDWMDSDDLIACPDPNCGGRFKITRLNKRPFKRADVTVTERKDDG